MSKTQDLCERRGKHSERKGDTGRSERGGDGEWWWGGGNGSERRCVWSTFSEAREYGGTLPSYFPEMIPQASGDHVMAPTPEGTTM